MTPSFVDDPAVARELGPARTEEVHASVQAVGDCATCQAQLGAGPLRLDVRGDSDVRLVHVRHAGCAPMPDDSVLRVVRLSTYRTNAALLPPMTTKSKGAFWRRDKTQERREVFLMVNPSVDVFTYLLDDQTLLDRYRSRGFREPGTVIIGSPDDANDAGVFLTMDGDSITLKDALGGTYEIGEDATIAASMRENGGALVALSFRNHTQDVRDMDSLYRFHADEEGTTEMWVPLVEGGAA